MEQSVARWAHNPEVAGSSPACATNFDERPGEKVMICGSTTWMIISLIRSRVARPKESPYTITHTVEGWK